MLSSLAPWEYDALKVSIRQYGVILPVVKDDQDHGRQPPEGAGLPGSGHENYPIITLRGLNEDEKRDRVCVLNQSVAGSIGGSCRGSSPQS